MPIEIRYPSKLKALAPGKSKRFKLAVGGRGSGKSQTFATWVALLAMQNKKILCAREFQNSTEDSVYSLIIKMIEQYGLSGFEVQATELRHISGGIIKFRGLARNPHSIKSLDGFNVVWVEEAQAISELSLELLLPTIRESDSELWFTANPQASEDAFSRRFVTPYESVLMANGIYEDDLHTIVRINFDDNKWFPKELEQQRQRDYETMPRSLYDHVWLGCHNDNVENALIDAAHFDACIDAHKKLGFKPVGARVSAHDPSDQGGDSKGFAFRHGSVFLDVQEMTTGTVNEGCDWATGLAIQHDSDVFIFDCDGMGVALVRQVDQAFSGHNRRIIQFRGSESPDNPDAIAEPSQSTPMAGQRSNADVFRNKRAMYYYQLRERCYKTWRAVEHGEYHNPDDLISFSSEIKCLQKLRSEVCRMPVKPNASGLFELYTKETMKTKFQIASPNLADSVMMCLRLPPLLNNAAVQRPRAIKAHGRR